MNGRVAIVDDKYNDVKCLLSDLSKHQIPYRFYHFEGDPEVLPDEADGENDFRILIMDLNLINDGVLDSKTLISSLLPVLQRLIPSTNYPYVFAYWSKHEDEHKDVIEKELFQKEELIHKQPIAFVSLDKSKYISMTGKPTTAPIKIFEEICTQLDSLAAYKVLLHWENIIHTSADTTIQDVFCFDSIYGQQWSNISLDLLSRFSKASLGHKEFKATDDETRIKSSISVLGPLFVDSLETSINNETFAVQGLDKVATYSDNNIMNVNTKLLIEQNVNVNKIFPGVLSSYKDQNELSSFMNEVLNFRLVESEARNQFILNLKNGKNNSLLPKRNNIPPPRKYKKNTSPDPWSLLTNSQQQRVFSKFRSELRKNTVFVNISLDPLCDHVQSKVKFRKFTDGVLFPDDQKALLDNNSEGIFISPSFKYNGINYLLVLSLKHLHTKKVDLTNLPFTPLLRVRQGMLAEIQSKLARFISRQGILFLDQ